MVFISVVICHKKNNVPTLSLTNQIKFNYLHSELKTETKSK